MYSAADVVCMVAAEGAVDHGRIAKRAQAAGDVSKRFSPAITAWMLMHLGLGYGVLAPIGISGHGRDESGQSVRDVIEQLMLGVK